MNQTGYIGISHPRPVKDSDSQLCCQAEIPLPEMHVDQAVRALNNASAGLFGSKLPRFVEP